MRAQSLINRFNVRPIERDGPIALRLSLENFQSFSARPVPHLANLQ